MNGRRWISLAVGLAAAVSLAGCGGKVGSILGFEKNAPDEFNVVKRAPLTLPPDFGLRPPRPGAARPQEVSARSQAEQSLIRKPRTRRTARAEMARRIGDRSSGEVALLKRAGALDVDPAIRQVVNRESAGTVDIGQEDFIDKLLFWRDEKDRKKAAAEKVAGEATIVDPAGEARRLKENAILGKPVTTGKTPTIRRKEAGILF